MANKNPRKGTPEYAYLQLSKETDKDVKRLVSSLRKLNRAHKKVVVRMGTESRMGKQVPKLVTAGSAVYRLIKVFQRKDSSKDWFYDARVINWLEGLSRIQDFYDHAIEKYSNIAKTDLQSESSEERTGYVRAIDSLSNKYEVFVSDINKVLEALMDVDPIFFSPWTGVLKNILSQGPRFKIVQLHNFLRTLHEKVTKRLEGFDEKEFKEMPQLVRLPKILDHIIVLERKSNNRNARAELTIGRNKVAKAFKEYQSKLLTVLEKLDTFVREGEVYLGMVNSNLKKVFTLGDVINEFAEKQLVRQAYKMFKDAVQNFSDAIQDVLLESETVRKSEHYAHDAITRRLIRSKAA